LALDFRNDAIAMTVADNGNGFELPPATGDLAASGSCVISAGARAAAGRTINMESKPGEVRKSW
jgi:hypothetical protein